MKINVCYVHSILLAVTILSSCILFILVASENLVHHSKSAPAQDLGEENQDKENEPKNDAKSDDSKNEENVNEIHSSFDESIAEKENDLKSNLSPIILSRAEVNNGLSTGQEIVFTLTDTASAELVSKVESVTLDSVSVTERTNFSSVKGKYTSQPIVVKIKSTEDNASESVETLDQKENYVVHAEPKNIEITEPYGDHVNASDSVSENLDEEEEIEEEAPVVPIDADTISTEVPPLPEDIPSFSEWSQKQLAEAEKKKVLNTSGTIARQANNKKRSKNYASLDCGSKIVQANPEAKSVSSVLNPSRDEYVLNTCNSRIWFVVELCEAIQAKKIELANFELFSSSPKEFTISVSDRFPSRDWRSVGSFTAEDERNVQSFDLNPQLFGKFIKFEMWSHYGSEHYCPISLFRVYGKSEFEVLETEDEIQEDIPEIGDGDDDDEPLDSEIGGPPNNLFGTARDAVLSMVKKAAEVLVKGGDSLNVTDILNLSSKDSSLETHRSHLCVTPSHIIVCDNCSDPVYERVYDLLSCHRNELEILINSSFVNSAVKNSNVCLEYGLDFKSHKVETPEAVTAGSYLSCLFPSEYIAALCNILAVLEKKVVLNVSSIDANRTITASNVSDTGERVYGHEILYENVLMKPTTCMAGSITSETCVTELLTESSTTVPLNVSQIQSLFDVDINTSEIRPTKTMSEEVEDLNVSVITQQTQILFSEVETDTSEIISPTVTTSESDAKSNFTVNNVKDSDQPKSVPAESDTDQVTTEASQDAFLLDSLFSELDQDSNLSSATTPQPPTSIHIPQAQKESVFLRLSNRIKALERNMSLSGQYLEELSRRYKKQMEEMQKAFDRTLAAIGEESRKGAEREIKRREEMAEVQERLASLANIVEMLMNERNSSFVIIQHGLLVLIEVGLFLTIMYFCRKTSKPNIKDGKQRLNYLDNPKKKIQLKRRKSAEEISEHGSSSRKRRPSEEFVRITGEDNEKLINRLNSGDEERKMENRKKKNRKKDSVHEMQNKSKVASRKNSSSNKIDNCSQVNPAELVEMWLTGPSQPSNLVENVSHSDVAQEEASSFSTSTGHNGISSFSFVKTATSVRSDRIRSATNFNHAGSSGNSSQSVSSLSAISVSGEEASHKKSLSLKEHSKKGLKKMVKKFF